MTLGEKLKLTRQKRGLSQQELALKAGIHQKNISKYEKDDVIPSAITLKSIADILEVSADYLLGNETENTSIKDIGLLKQFKDVDSMPDKDKTTIMDVLNAYIRDFKARKAYTTQ